MSSSALRKRAVPFRAQHQIRKLTLSSQIDEKDLDLQVAWVAGDNLMDKAQELLRNGMKHLDAENANIKLVKNTDNFLDDPKKPIVGCNAYLGARAITKGLQEGADIIICGFCSLSTEQ